MKHHTTLTMLTLALLLASAPAGAQDLEMAMAMIGQDYLTAEQEALPLDGKGLKLVHGLPPLNKPLPLLIYPVRAQNFQIEGRVMVQYIVNEKGRVENLKVLTGPGAGCKAEVKRVLRASRFEPALDAQGNPVAIEYISTFDFRLN